VLDFMLHPPHHAPLQELGEPCLKGQIMQLVGHFSGVEQGRREMQTPWMSQHGMSQAVPPAYTEWVGRQLIAALDNLESGATANNSRVTFASPIAEAATA
jgi:DNA (cytosine-5)-methyltransferase 1